MSRQKMHRGRIGAVALVLSLALAAPGGGATEAAGCETPFVVYTDPANPGMSEQTGAVSYTHSAGLLGEYGGDGRFAGYSINGEQTLILDTTTGTARAQGHFVASSPDGSGSIEVGYVGLVDFGAGMATGTFTAGSGTGDDAGYHASGTLSGMVVGPATLEGVNAGLC